MGSENEKLKYIIKETLWMARRYADGRRTFAPSSFNEAVHVLDDMGLGHLMLTDSVSNTRFADDGDLGRYNPETRRFERELEKSQ